MVKQDTINYIMGIDGGIIGGFIAGASGVAVAFVMHLLALRRADKAAKQAKKEAAVSYLVEIELNQHYIRRFLDLGEPEKLVRYDIRFARSINSALSGRLGELPCRDEIAEYYDSLDRLESTFEVDPKLRLRFEQLKEVPLFAVIDEERLKTIESKYNNKQFWFWAGVLVILEQIEREGGELVKCLEREISAEG